ncbi:sensor histidine kinase [Streptomyces tardus]|nr:histidine kinase [Streptomyces tardus]
MSEFPGTGRAAGAAARPRTAYAADPYEGSQDQRAGRRESRREERQERHRPGPITRAARWVGGGPEPWTAGQIVGELLTVPLLTLLALSVQMIDGGSVTQVAALLLLTLVVCVVRRSFPGTALLTVAGVSAALPGLGALLPIVGWSAGKRIVEPWRALAFLGTAFLLDLGGNLHGSYLTEGGSRSLMGVFVSAVWFLAMVTIPGLTARYLHQRRSLLAAIRAQHHQLIRENSIIARETRMRERQRIARDMHDSLGHHLTLIAVHTGALQVDAGLSGQQREAVGVLREASVTAMRELREVVGILKDEEGDGTEAASAPGVPDLPELVASSHRAGTAVSHTVTGTPRALAPAADQAAYRIVQEGLTNAHKHAPGSPVAVGLRYEPDVLLVEVVNNPAPGGDPDAAEAASATAVSGGRGLDGLGERARAAGGMLHHGPYGTGGFRLAGALPYDAVTPAVDARQQRAVRDLDRAVVGRSRGCLPSALAIGGLLIALVVTGVVWLGLDIERSLVDQDTYRGVRVGQQEDLVRERLPRPSSFAGILDAEHPRPKDATCVVMFSAEALNKDGTGDLARFCFRDGKLIQKLAFD